MRPRVLAVSGSPALDRVVVAPGAGHGGTVRTTEVLDTPGGKAAHVAVVAALLGVEAEVVLPLGGARGAVVRALLDQEPVAVTALDVVEETRRTTTVVDPAAGDVLELLEPAPPLTTGEADALVDLAARRAGEARVAVVSGSAPLGAPELPLRLARAVRAAHAFTVVDTSGDALAAALDEADIVAPNIAEACALLGSPVPGSPSPEEVVAVARALVARGARAAWVSAGAQGSAYASGTDAAHLAAPPAGARVNAVGCGDALLGGFAAGLAKGLDPLAAARLGVAAATDKLGRLHPARVDRAAVFALAPRVETTPAPR